jgi:tRNA-splicing ligase RtcB
MMPTKIGNVLNYASLIEDNTMEQATNTAAMPFIEGHVALMPDAHLGYGGAVGSVVPTRGAIMPSTVGVDIGCGMAAIMTGFTASDLPDNLDALHSAIEKAVPAGVGQGHDHTDRGSRAIYGMQSKLNTWLTDKQIETASKQMGTLGSGNHFVEVCLDADDRVWIVLHSGSRGIGNQLARIHIEKAENLMAEYFIQLPDPKLAYLVEGSAEFKAYWADLQWAQEYAFRNRLHMLGAVLNEFGSFLAQPVKSKFEVNCHHNYSALENHRGKNIYVTRKGAISARAGEWGIIPGSMGTSSFIVKGLGNTGSYTSAPHGAGRRMGRKAAERAFSYRDLEDRMEGIAWNLKDAGKLVDEIPDSYKDIHTVIADSAELVAVHFELTQILNYKGA